ncbi:hypothetical protein EXU85_08110 [Spirosoma sp. KCTC 42546]|nr:hypothetical protein EXU85_08110 [Spirosoma sp. KCTC 42546]
MNKMSQNVCRCWFITILATLWGTPVWAQSIETQPLAVTSICAGTQLDVTGRLAGVTGNLVVEMASDGTTFSAIASVPLATSVSNEVVYRATIPGNTVAGGNYRIRLMANDPAVTSIPSPTLLTVKGRPAPPSVDSLILDCMRVLPSADVSSYVSSTAAAGATVNIYTYTNNTFMPAGSVFTRISLGSTDNVILSLGKTYYPTSTTYKYPMEEHSYYLTQSVETCESDTVKTKLRILYRPFTGPMPTNGKPVDINPHWPTNYYGTLGYCVGDQAPPLSENGHAAPPENYRVLYQLGTIPGRTSVPPIPATDVPSTQVYQLQLDPIDLAKGCSSFLTTQLTVTVSAPPSVSITPSSTVLTPGTPMVSLTAVGTGTYLWSTGATTEVISVTTSGTYSVTLTSPGGCTASASVRVAGPDLTINLELPQANFAASGSVGNFVVTVFEVAGLPTSAGNVTITITVPIGYTLAFPPGMTSIQVSGGDTKTVSNNQWTVVSSLESRQLTLTMASGSFIGGGGASSLGFQITRTNANSGSQASITVNVADDLTMTYDGNLANNVYARIISGL